MTLSNTTGALDAVRQIYAHKGIRGFYNGFAPCIARSFPANAALLVLIYIHAHTYIHTLMYVSNWSSLVQVTVFQLQNLNIPW